MRELVLFVRRFLAEKAGSAMLEFAIGSSLLITASTATFQYGYVFYQYNELKNATYSGARWASMAAYDSANEAPSDAFRTKVQNMVVYGNPAGTGEPVLKNLSRSNVQVQVTFNNAVPVATKVSIVNYTIDGIFGSMNCNNKPAATFAYQGIWSPIP